MKKLKDNVLLYDAACPLCKVYSKGFVAAGMLEKEGRMDYAGMRPEISTHVDVNRARNEIALVNSKTGDVKYGIFSLFAIIEHSFPVFKPLFNWVPFQRSMKRVYSFVSFNRRVIICGSTPESPNSCNPDFNLNYRIAYLVFAVLFAAFVLNQFSPLLQHFWPVPQGFGYEVLLAGGQVLFQAAVLWFIAGERRRIKIMDYAGNLMTVSVMGSLLLLPALLLNKVLPDLRLEVYMLWFGLAVAAMFFEHKRRVRVYSLPSYLSYTWVLYRLFILLPSLF